MGYAKHRQEIPNINNTNTNVTQLIFLPTEAGGSADLVGRSADPVGRSADTFTAVAGRSQDAPTPQEDAKEGSGRSTAEKLRRRTSTFRSASGKVPATFRLEHASAPIVRETCASNGMVQVDTQDFCLLWSGPGLKESAYRDMHEYQRINHFPRSTELTRKDNMYAHLTTMAQEFSYEALGCVGSGRFGGPTVASSPLDNSATAAIKQALGS